ncbi:MAG: hypothetical protein ACD_30C00033G0001 [uncultured bacterium]|nr:MAG: hypothetical protein ACD_30C00033G0001 [uncultured bacterium]
MFGKDVAIADAEVEKFLEDNKAQLPDMTEASAEAKQKLNSEIKDQLLQQKINENFNQWLTTNLSGSRVSRL